MGGKQSKPNTKPIKRFFEKIFPPPDPCKNDRNKYNNNEIIKRTKGDYKNSLKNTDNGLIKQEKDSLDNRDYFKKKINDPLDKAMPISEDIKINIIHKESFCNKYNLTKQNDEIRGYNDEINKLNMSISNRRNNINIYENESKILKKKIKDPLLDKKGYYVSPPNLVPKDNFHIDENYYNRKNQPNLFYQSNLDLDIPVLENFTESFDTPKTYTGGLQAQTTAYQTLYNNYYNAYNKGINLIQNNLQPEIDFLKLTELTGLQYAFTGVKVENDLINQQIQENNNSYSTDNKQFFYQTENLVYLKSINFVIFIIYYIAFLIFLYFMIFVKTSDIKILIFIILIFLLYPFIIKSIEEFFYFIITFTISTLFGNVYIMNE